MKVWEVPVNALIKAITIQPGSPAFGKPGYFAIWLCLIGLLFVSAGCSVQRMAVSAMAPVIEDSLKEAYTTSDIETAREAIPGQMLMLRGMMRTHPDNITICTAAVQLYASYAMVFIGDDDPERGARLYDEGMFLGLRFLKRSDWFRKAWEQGPDALRAEITKRNPEALGPLLMWVSSCLGQHIMNNMDQAHVLADLPYVYVLTDMALALDGEYYYGMPYVMKGALLARTPPMFGGDLEEAQRLFDKAFEISDNRFLYHHILYATYVCVAALDEERFTATLEAVLGAADDLFPEAQLMNVVSKERAADLLEMKEDLF
jgi:TRAP transporter T-component